MTKDCYFLSDKFLSENFSRSLPATQQDIEFLEGKLKLVLPPDYLRLLYWSNGFSGAVGSAKYFFWSIDEILNRNVSAKIWHYLSSGFVGIGSNGGDKFYGLDYTHNINAPSFSIVPMGDLCNESKYIIAECIIDAFELSLNDGFDDMTYDDMENVELSPEIARIKLTNKRRVADDFWTKKNYGEYIEAVEVLGSDASNLDLRRRIFAEKMVGK